MNLNELTRDQLLKASDAVDMFIFAEADHFLKGEPWAPSYKKDPKHFKEILRLLVRFKRDLMTYFNAQYENRYNLIRQSVIQHAEAIDDYYDPVNDTYFYPYNWDNADNDLAKILEKHTKEAYDLGITALLLLAAYATTHTSDDQGAQQFLLDNAKTMSTNINEVTQKRLKKAIDTSLELGEDREDFEKRIKKIFVNPYRGRFIAQQETLKSYLKGKDEAATSDSSVFTKKTWTGIQDDKSEICGGVIGDTVGIDDKFANDLDGPLAHMGCRCDLVYS